MNPLRNFRWYRKLFNRRSWFWVHRASRSYWVRRWEILDTDQDGGDRNPGWGRTSRRSSEPFTQDT